MSGGLFGKGPAQGVLKEKIPDASTDFIFAVAGEELGFVTMEDWYKITTKHYKNYSCTIIKIV